MRPEVKGFILKEYGAWSVMIISCLVGVGVSRAWSWNMAPLFLALAFLINSKQAYMKWVRRADDRAAFAIFLIQILVAAVMLAVVFRGDMLRLLPLLAIPAAYLVINKLRGEHFILTELLGFVLLSLAAVLAKFLLTDDLDGRLLIGTALYFAAGVFKVKAIVLRKKRERILAVLAVAVAVIVYGIMHIPLIILLPLADNLIAAATLYKVKLRTTGWIEVIKSLLFLGLFIAFF